jgi:hypothetical protein
MAKPEQKEAGYLRIIVMPRSKSSKEDRKSDLDTPPVSAVEGRLQPDLGTDFDLVDEEEDPAAFFRGLIIALPISLLLWGIIIWATLTLIA